MIISSHWIKKHYSVTVDWKSSAKIFLSSTAAAVTYTTITQPSFSSWIKLILGLTIFLPFFIITIILTRTINRSDINNLRES